MARIEDEKLEIEDILKALNLVISDPGNLSAARKALKLSEVKLHLHPEERTFEVTQGQVAITNTRSGILTTTGLFTCVGLGAIANGIRFCAHIDSITEVEFLANAFKTLTSIAKKPSKEINFHIFINPRYEAELLDTLKVIDKALTLSDKKFNFIKMEISGSDVVLVEKREIGVLKKR